MADRTFRPSPDVVHRTLDGEAVMLDLVSGTYFGLNEVGTRVWELLGDGRRAEQIVSSIVAEYDADVETVRRDVTRLIDELVARRLVVPGPGGAEP